MSEKETQEETQEKEPKGPVLNEQAAPRVQNPALFLGIIAIVVGFGLFVGLNKSDNVLVETDREAYVAEQAQAEGGDLLDMPMLDVIRQTAGTPETTETPEEGSRGAVPEEAEAVESPAVDDTAQVPAEEPSCDFSRFVGRQYDETLLQSIKDAANSERPFRIIKPEDMYTQDYNPARVNINLDESGQIAKIWCG